MDEKLKKELQSVKGDIRSVVISTPIEIDVMTLSKDYRNLTGEFIPYAKFGCSGVLQFLRERCKDVIDLIENPRGPNINPLVRARITEKNAHIHNMVSKQKVTPTMKQKARNIRMNAQSSRYGQPQNRNVPWHNTNSIQRNKSAPVSYNPIYERNTNKTNQTNYEQKRQEYKTEPANCKQDKEEYKREQKNYEPERLCQTEKSNYAQSKPDYKTEQHNRRPERQEYKTEQRNDGEDKRTDESKDKLTILDYQTEQRKYWRETQSVENIHQNSNVLDDTCDQTYEETQSVGRESKRSSEQDSGRPSTATYDVDMYEMTKSNLALLLTHYPQGVPRSKLERLYKETFNKKLCYKSMGYMNLIQMCCCLDDVFHMLRPDPYGDWVLMDARKPKPSQAQLLRQYAGAQVCADAQSESSDDPLPGAPYDDCIFPADCMQHHESLPSRSVSDFNIGKYYIVGVTEVLDPSHFWLQQSGDEYFTALQVLMDDMTEYYTNGEGREREMQPGAIQVGQYCSAPYAYDGYHRSIIVQILDGNSVKVRHVDYGTVAVVQKSALRVLKREYASLPTQAIRARLTGIKPLCGTKWPYSSAVRFLKLVDSVELWAGIAAIDYENQTIEITLASTTTSKDVFINDTLVQEKHAKLEFIDPDILEPFLLPSFEDLENGRAMNFNTRKMLLDNCLEPDLFEKVNGMTITNPVKFRSPDPASESTPDYGLRETAHEVQDDVIDSEPDDYNDFSNNLAIHSYHATDCLETLEDFIGSDDEAGAGLELAYNRIPLQLPFDGCDSTLQIESRPLYSRVLNQIENINCSPPTSPDQMHNPWVYIHDPYSMQHFVQDSAVPPSYTITRQTISCPQFPAHIPQTNFAPITISQPNFNPIAVPQPNFTSSNATQLDFSPSIFSSVASSTHPAPQLPTYTNVPSPPPPIPLPSQRYPTQQQASSPPTSTQGNLEDSQQFECEQSLLSDIAARRSNPVSPLSFANILKPRPDHGSKSNIASVKPIVSKSIQNTESVSHQNNTLPPENMSITQVLNESARPVPIPSTRPLILTFTQRKLEMFMAVQSVAIANWFILEEIKRVENQHSTAPGGVPGDNIVAVISLMPVELSIFRELTDTNPRTANKLILEKIASSPNLNI